MGKLAGTMQDTVNARPAAEPVVDELMPLGDVGMRRELALHRLAVSMLRKFMRVVALHCMDAALLAGVILGLDLIDPAVGYRALLPGLVLVFLLSLNAAAAYSPGDARRDRGRLFWGTLLAALIFVSFSVLPPHLPLAPGAILALAIGAFLALAVGRKLADLAVRQAYTHGIGLRRAVIVGNLEEVASAIHQLRDERNIDQYIVGHLAPDQDPDPAALALLSDLPRIVRELHVQELVLATSLSPQMVRWIADRCFERGVLLYVFPSVLAKVDCRIEPLRVRGVPLLSLTPTRIEVPALLVKRVFDLCLSILALVVLAPILLLIALAIKLDSPGPVIFRQKRIGLGGKPFTIWKFRSMHAASEGQRDELAAQNTYPDRRLFKLPRDPRITRVGRLLRRSSMDELPQLLNVVRGEMSLVGPRPPLPCEVDEYKPHHFERLSVIPGITGPWQVGGRNLITDFETVVRMERAYIQSWSLLLDAKILVRTVRVVLSGEGAY